VSGSRLLFDLSATQSIGKSRFHGGGEYARAVFQALLAREPGPGRLAGAYLRQGALDPWITEAAERGLFAACPIDDRHGLTALAADTGITRFYSALPYNLGDVDLPGVETWMTIHGLRTLEMPWDRYRLRYERGLRTKLRRIRQRLFRNATLARERARFDDLFRRHPTARVIVPSRHTRNSLLSFFPHLDRDRVTVLYSPRPNRTPDAQTASTPASLPEVIRDGPCFLVLNADRWIKNSHRAVRSFDRFFHQHTHQPHRVVLLGSPGMGTFAPVRNTDRFVHLDYVSSATLDSLLAQAHALFYPSLNEGFGYPPLQAMAHGTPVAASAITSIPEVCGDAALYFNPFDEHEMVCRISELCFDDLEGLRERGRRRAQWMAAEQDRMLEDLVDRLLE